MLELFQNPFRKLDNKNKSYSSNTLKKQVDIEKTVNARIRVVIGVILVCFSIIMIQLIHVQLFQTEYYKNALETASLNKDIASTPRGQIYDRNGKVVAKTLTSYNITYFPTKDISAKEMFELAEQFANTFDVDISKLSENDLQTIYLQMHTNDNGKKDMGESLLSEEEKKQIKNSEDAIGQGEQLKRSHITQKMLDGIDDKTRKVYTIYITMQKEPMNSKKVILEDVSNETVAYLVEHKLDFPGFDVDFSSWKREYPFGDSLRDVMGNVSNNKQGLPEELSAFYQAKGYSLNERVGISGLEEQYEELLKGTSTVNTIRYDEQGIAVFDKISAGKKGYNIHMNIDMDLQQFIDNKLKSVLESAKNNSSRKDFKKVFVVLMNPKTGEIYASSGMLMNDNGKIYPYSSGVYMDANMPGSVVKGATVYMGLNEKAVSPGEIIVDEPMKIAGTSPKASYHNYGPLNDIQALSQSSNIYMFHIAIRLAKGHYVPNQSLGINDSTSTFALMRYYYSMFGLGVKTGLDIPKEETGFKDNSEEAGRLLDYAIGQFDSYTPIQLVQYAATIANNGYKVTPRFVSYATEANSNSIIFENKATLESQLTGNLEYIKRIQDGFRQCVTSGNCGVSMKNVSTPIAAKTGTAEVFVNGKPTTNSALIGYGPYTNANVAFACVAPTSSSAQDLQNNVCYTDIMAPVLEEFFKKY